MNPPNAGTLRKPQSMAEYLSRDNEWTHRWAFRETLKAVTAEYRALFEKEQQDRAKALAALRHDLARAHERIADQERALEAYRAGTWESGLQLRWARAKLAVRTLLRFRSVVDQAELSQRMLAGYQEAESLRPLNPQPRAGEDRD